MAAVVVAPLLYSLWLYENHKASYFVAATYDKLTKIASGRDPLRRCFETRHENGFDSTSFIGSRKCHDFGPQKRFSGIYFDEFEGQWFIESAKPSKKYVANEQVWLTFDEETELNGFDLETGRNDKTRILLVEFIGRETSGAGSYGHLGGSDKEIVVDKIVRAELIQEGKGYLSNDMVEFKTASNSDNPR